MAKLIEKIFVIIAGIGLLLVLLFVPISDSYLGLLFNAFSDPDWNKIPSLYLVKNSIPIILIESNDDVCLMNAQNFDTIISHKYFINSDDLVNVLNFDKIEKTITISCDELIDEKSRLNVWYIVEESPQHAGKFQYFITKWN